MTNQKTDLISFDIKIAGAPLNPNITINSISIYKALNKINTATIEINDGNISDAEFTTIKDNKYEPGAEVEISLGYHDNNDKVFKGIVVKHSIKISNSKASKVLIECSDKAIALTGQKKFEYFKDKKDSQVITSLCKLAGLSSDIEGTSKVHEMVMQHNVSNWDFIVTRAQANGMLVFADLGKVSVKKPSTSGAKWTYTYGLDIIDLDINLDARNQIKNLTASCWDPKTQKIVEVEAEEPTDLEKLGSLKGSTIAGKLKYENSEIHSTGNMDSTELQAWADGSLAISRLSRIKGTVTVPGCKLDPMDTIQLASLGAYYDGDAYVTGVYHDLSEGNWTTECEIGLNSDLFSAQNTDMALPIADGLFPGVHGLFIGIVKKIDGDPAGEGRVQIYIPMITDQEGEGTWARISNIMASNNYGSWFMPEEKDEVICGALGGDMRFPIILGHLYSSNANRKYHEDEFTYDGENNFKGWITRSKLLLHFDDKEKIVRIETPGKQKFKLDDKDESITLEDTHGNKMVMDKDGFLFDSSNKFIVNAKNDITQTSKMGDVGLKASSGKFEANGSMGATMKSNMSVDVTGNTSAKLSGGTTTTVKGGISVEVNSSGIATLKGSLVKIN